MSHICIGGVATHRSTFGRVNSNYVLGDVNCTGNESNIFDCQHSQSVSCTGGLEEAGVLCGVSKGLPPCQTL